MACQLVKSERGFAIGLLIGAIFVRHRGIDGPAYGDDRCVGPLVQGIRGFPIRGQWSGSNLNRTTLEARPEAAVRAIRKGIMRRTRELLREGVGQSGNSSGVFRQGCTGGQNRTRQARPLRRHEH